MPAFRLRVRLRARAREVLTTGHEGVTFHDPGQLATLFVAVATRSLAPDGPLAKSRAWLRSIRRSDGTCHRDAPRVRVGLVKKGSGIISSVRTRSGADLPPTPCQPQQQSENSADTNIETRSLLGSYLAGRLARAQNDTPAAADLLRQGAAAGPRQ